MPDAFALLKHDELREKCDKIAGNLRNHYDLPYSSVQELSSKMFSELYERGGKVIYDNIEKEKSLDDIMATLGGYAKAVGNTSIILDMKLKECSMERYSHDEKINDEKNSFLKDNKADTERDAIDNIMSKYDTDIIDSLLNNSEYIDRIEKIAIASNSSVEDIKNIILNYKQ